jgi:hypothetical protein
VAEESLTGAVAGAKGNDLLGGLSTADGVGAVTDAVLEVVVLAQACGIIGLAAEGGSQGDHVVDAGLLERCEPWWWGWKMEIWGFKEREGGWDWIGRLVERGPNWTESGEKKQKRTYTTWGEAADLGLGQDDGGQSTEDESGLHFEGWRTIEDEIDEMDG